MNVYAYVGNDSINWIDPSGNGPEDVLVGLGVLIVPPMIAIIDGAIDNTVSAWQYWHEKNDYNEGSSCPADAPGVPTEKDGFKAKKKWDGKRVLAPNGKGYGYPDRKGNVWIPTGPKGHGGAHWDVQKPGGGYINVYPDGKTRGGR